VCRSKHVEPSINFGIINSITKLHLVGISTESYYDARIHEYQISYTTLLQVPEYRFRHSCYISHILLSSDEELIVLVSELPTHTTFILPLYVITYDTKGSCPHLNNAWKTFVFTACGEPYPLWYSPSNHITWQEGTTVTTPYAERSSLLRWVSVTVTCNAMTPIGAGGCEME